MAILTPVDFVNAKRDISDIGRSVNEDTIVQPRWGGAYDSLPRISRLWLERFDLLASNAESMIQEWRDAINLITVEGGIPALAVSDSNGKNQQEINSEQKEFNSKSITTVDSIADLSVIPNPKNGQTIFVKSHYANLFTGSGTYQFEQLSSKQDNGGTWIASTVSAGTWVLISENFIEHFGVIPDGTDQSTKIQSALDFYLANNIRSFGFEKSNKYSVAAPIRLKQYKASISESYADPKLGTIFSFNGVYLEALTDNQKVIVVSRDNVQINNPVITTTKSGVVGIYNGLDVENNDLTLRRSSMRMVLNNPKFERLDIGMKFESAETKDGAHWGSFYHCVYNPHAVATNIMFDFRQSIGDGGNSNTRNTIVGVKHVGGSCTIYGEALESSLFLGIESEFISRPDARLPNGEAVVLHLPFGTPSDFQANKGNRFTAFNIEVCTNYINVNAPDTHIDGFQQGATNPLVKAWIYNNTYANVSQVIGGSRMVAYNTTPRFGMIQINDDSTTASLYIERGSGAGDYKILADGLIEIPKIKTLDISATNNIINFKTDGSLNNLRLNIDSAIGMYFEGSGGYVGFTGDFRPALDNWSSIGVPTTNRVKNIYLVNAPSVSSDIRYKQDIRRINEIEKIIAREIKLNIKSYKLKCNLDKLHIGVIAQDIVSIFEKNGLNALDYNMIELSEGYYSIKYEELIMFILSV